MSGEIVIRDLPEWLQNMIYKKLIGRMSSLDAESYMNGTIDNLNEIFGI